MITGEKNRAQNCLTVSNLNAIRICDTDTGIDPSFVDIKSTAVETKNFKSQ